MSGPRRHTRWLTATCRSHQGPISHQWVIDTHESLSELVSSHIILPELSRPCQVWLAHISTWQCPLWTGWRAGRSGGWRCWPGGPGHRPWSSVKSRLGGAGSRGQPPWWWSAGEAALGPLCPRHSWSVSPSLIWMCWQLWSPLRALTWHLSTCHHMCQCTQSLILAGTQAWQAQENLGSCYSHVNFTFTPGSQPGLIPDTSSLCPRLVLGSVFSEGKPGQWRGQACHTSVTCNPGTSDNLLVTPSLVTWDVLLSVFSSLLKLCVLSVEDCVFSV